MGTPLIQKSPTAKFNKDTVGDIVWQNEGDEELIGIELLEEVYNENLGNRIEELPISNSVKFKQDNFSMIE